MIEIVGPMMSNTYCYSVCYLLRRVHVCSFLFFFSLITLGGKASLELTRQPDRSPYRATAGGGSIFIGIPAMRWRGGSCVCFARPDVVPVDE